MNFKAAWINKLVQFGAVNYDLILTEVDGLIPPVRTSKKFRMKEADVTDQFLSDEAAREITLIEPEIAKEAYEKKYAAAYKEVVEIDLKSQIDAAVQGKL